MTDNQIAERNSTEVAAPQSEADAMLTMIERVASNPDADLDKMQKMLDMREQMLNRQAEQEFSRAMNAAQSKMGRVATDANNPQTRSKYATYAALDRALRPVYSAEGFSLSFDTSDSAPETVKVVCHVFHSGGHTKTYSVVMPADGKGAKGGDAMTKTHAAGAAMSYGMRYLLKMIFNVAVGEDDNDGNAPGSGIKRVSPADIKRLRDATKMAGKDDAYICYKAGIQRIEELDSRRVDAAINHLKTLAQGPQQ